MFQTHADRVLAEPGNRCALQLLLLSYMTFLMRRKSSRNFRTPTSEDTVSPTRGLDTFFRFIVP